VLELEMEGMHLRRLCIVRHSDLRVKSACNSNRVCGDRNWNWVVEMIEVVMLLLLEAKV
jgi:hypothetical protein